MPFLNAIRNGLCLLELIAGNVIRTYTPGGKCSILIFVSVCVCV